MTLTDYRVLIVGVDNERVKEWIENRRLVATDTGLTTDARSLAGQIGLLKAIKDWNLRRLISFHGRVKGARYFRKTSSKLASGWMMRIDRQAIFGRNMSRVKCPPLPASKNSSD